MQSHVWKRFSPAGSATYYRQVVVGDGVVQNRRALAAVLSA